MSTRFIHKTNRLADITNLPTSAGIGFYGGRFYGNFNGTVAPLDGYPSFGNVWLVDGDNGSDTDDRLPFKTIQAAVTAASQGDTIYIKALEGDSAAGETDPDSYLENITIPAGKDGVSLVGVARGLAQGAQPQLKTGTATTSPLITVEAFGVMITGLTLNGASATGGGVKIVSDETVGARKDAGGLVIQGCHFKNCKGSAAAATGGAIWWSAGGSWYVSIYGNEFIDCRAGISVTDTSTSVPRHVKIVGNRFGSAVNTTVDADIYVSGSGVLDLFIDSNVFATVDGPAYASSPDAARYIKLVAGTSGLISNNVFACMTSPTSQTELTFGATGTGAIVPTTVRFAQNYGEANVGGVGVEESGIVYRT
jgi:hypothetical protein